MVGIAAGVFALMALAMLMHGIAWLLNDLFFSGNVWAGFLIEAGFWFLVAAGAGLFAYRSVQAGAPPTPELAIEEAKRIKETLEAGRAMSDADVYVSGAGEPVAARAPGPPGRSSDQIRTDIERHRTELSHSVEALRGRVGRAHRLAPPDPRAPPRAGDRRRRRRLRVGGLIALRRR